MSDETTISNVLQDVSEKHEVSCDLLAKMLELERDKLHLTRRMNIRQELRHLLRQELEPRGRR